MISYNIGDMFWGKSQSYPWWPCIIMTNSSNEIKRTRKKTGTQYHVQFIAPYHDTCWITNNFLIKYDGTENFESYVEQQLRSSLPPQQKLLFEMKMSGQVQAMWIQACQDAEKMRSLSNEERIQNLPKESESTNIKKPKSKKSVLKSVTKAPDGNSVTDSMSIDGKFIDEDFMTREYLTCEVEEMCRKVYLAEELDNRKQNGKELLDPIEMEKLINDQWAVLDMETKFLYFDGVDAKISKSRVSGRKIKVPSRLRRTNDLENIKKAALKKRASETGMDKKTTNSSELNVKIPNGNCDDSQMTECCSLSPPQSNTIYRETIDSAMLASLQIQDSSMEIVKLLNEQSFSPKVDLCHQCLQPLKANDPRKICKGNCGAHYHFICAIKYKIFRQDDINNCVNCQPKDFLCCICKNSKYMKQQFLNKCSMEGCQSHFHVTCLKYLNFNEATVDERMPLLCPNHSCLTCTREDNKHPCNNLGTFMSCTKCPISYHKNLFCIPAGCQLMTHKTLICHRHFDYNVLSTKLLSRCFVCFTDNATLRCCRCPSVFHPKCMNMPTYTDLLKDYVCPTCKLEQPLYYGQMVWTEINDIWSPAEIIYPKHVPDNVVIQSDKSLVVRIVETGAYHQVTSGELISFAIGESVLKGLKIDDKDVLIRANQMHSVYQNWRMRMRPFKLDKCPIIGPAQLVKLSVINALPPIPTISQYESISSNIIDTQIENGLAQARTTKCSCENGNELCGGDYCHNVINRIECHDGICNNHGKCQNRKYNTLLSVEINVTEDNVINGYGIKISNQLVPKGELIGECTGKIISSDTAFKMMNEHSNLSPDYFIFQLKDNLFLDCSQYGNQWRHLNHSCDPNAELVCWQVSDQLRLGVYSLRPIYPDDEVTVDYTNSLVLKYAIKCHCQATKCAKFVGPTSIFNHQSNIVVPRCCMDNGFVESSELNCRPPASVHPPHARPDIKPTIIPLKSLIKPELQQTSIELNGERDRTICHRCKGFGEFIVCNKSSCHKRYHLHCVDLSSAPRGLWLCPKHFCVVCGLSATVFCGSCSTSHCKNHSKLHDGHDCSNYVKSIDGDCDLEVKPKLDVESITKLEGQALSEQTTRSTNSPDISPFITKNDLYSSCDLVPISTDFATHDESDQSSSLGNSNCNSPNQVNLTIKRRSELVTDNHVNDEPAKKMAKFCRASVCNISNYQSADEDVENAPSLCSIEEPADIRCQVVPMSIEDMENLIISPMLLDD